MPYRLNLPNLLTLSRLAAAPVIMLAIRAGHHTAALVLFAAAAVTDVLDGIAARRLDLITAAGTKLDPIADKCLLSGVVAALAAAGFLPWWFVAVVLGRDLYLVVGAGVLMLASGVRDFLPSVWGKVSTFVQIATITLWMARNAGQLHILDQLSEAMLWLCTAFTIWSGIHYTWRGIASARNADDRVSPSGAAADPRRDQRAGSH
jgi:cardiolipin synthase